MRSVGGTFESLRGIKVIGTPGGVPIVVLFEVIFKVIEALVSSTASRRGKYLVSPLLIWAGLNYLVWQSPFELKQSTSLKQMLSDCILYELTACQ